MNTLLKSKTEIFPLFFFNNEEDKGFGNELKRRIRFKKTTKFRLQENKQNTQEISEKQTV